MKTKVEICHIDSDRCVVRVSGIEGEQDLGSSLGEAADAEQAEDRARERLVQRVLMAKPPTERKHPVESSVKKQEQGEAKPPKTQQVEAKNEQSRSEPSRLAPSQDQTSQPKAVSGQIAETITEQISEPSEAPIDPDDWSEELTAIDLQLKRIGWTREHEHMYLERAYGHRSRHKLTRYSDLVSYLNMLKSFEVGAEASAVQTPLRRGDLITQGDEILTTLKWDQERAKSFLQSKLGATSRQQLSDEQLFEFNMFLEEQLIAKMPKGNQPDSRLLF